MSLATVGHTAEIYDQPLTEPSDELTVAEQPTNPAAAGFDSLYRVASSLPEPMNWAMMIIGFGAAGQILRRRRALGHL